MSNLPRPSRAGGLLAVALALAAALAWPGPPPAGAAEPPALGLGLPLSCEIGKTCWIVNYVDLDKSKKVRDYNCGKSSYDGHKGVDFAIRDMGVMRKGVPVLAAAAGTVAGLRDGMKDVDFNLIGGPRAVKGKECGNGVTLRHKDGWSTQYCHLRRGSVSVRKGQRVAAGERLGLVGHSGLAMFPHVHIQVRKGRKIVDPFVGAGPSKKCGLGVTPLWKRQVLAALPYQSTAIYSAGFSATKPEVRGVRDGKYQETELPRNAAKLFLWAEIFHVRAGDRLTLTITGPDGKTLVRSSMTEKRDLARAFRPGGIPRPGDAWPEGVYRGEFRLTRKAGAGQPRTFTAVRRITIR
ncbi:MAG: M23 family metallopeptidase [Rhodospirillales bacterium]|nr:M23 family metallopeptidase [Rhodospirillales bacterium]MDP6773694.1 M23 family metallopeptidase [Rhodospirillales bacterium]